MSLTAVAEVVLANAKELDKRGVVDIESKIGFRDPTQSDLDCRSRLITAIRELERMALGPAETIYNMLMASTGDITSLLTLSRYAIPTHVPPHGTTTIAALAQKCTFTTTTNPTTTPSPSPSHTLDAQTLARLLRPAIVSGIFAEGPEPGSISHTPTSRLLLRDPDFLDLIGFYAEENGAAAGKATLDGLERWRNSREPAETGFAVAAAAGQRRGERKEEPDGGKHGGGEGGGEGGAGFFAELRRDPARVKRAAGAFNALPQMLVQGNDGLAASRVWREVDASADDGGAHGEEEQPDDADAAAAAAAAAGTALVVDVGGNRGHASMAIADATSARVRFVVEDLAGPVALGERGLPDEYRGRVSFRVQDFFEEQAVVGADVYFLRKVLHDFPDHYCVRIVRALVPALKRGARVVVCDRLMPDMAKAGYEQREARFSDLTMLQLLNGRERTETDWKELFAEADSRFDVEFEHWTGNLHGLIIATWRPEQTGHQVKL
ncbi:s-adenosyl-l-methionine-dependent methyltransferase [Diplodia corticola]|uniref:S-adenosyl-l-methionine-dependent methyltransferase n=1 Tax=Diplodia corticola TaxID=236234 RepID=A0A1J9SLZ2_9PEZI|nr:s-adenosyl-l-methionine-dependent methyltransferase [Diplodia corticola]OJD40629.1 s-adenosyl-l-methionine-dependent methyltransferase [Diplodia corticola]